MCHTIKNYVCRAIKTLKKNEICSSFEHCNLVPVIFCERMKSNWYVNDDNNKKQTKTFAHVKEKKMCCLRLKWYRKWKQIVIMKLLQYIQCIVCQIHTCQICILHCSGPPLVWVLWGRRLSNHAFQSCGC